MGNNVSKVKNEPKIKNKLIVAVREQLEHRAIWLYLLCDEAGKQGLDWWDFGSKAIRRCGIFQGKNLVRKGKTKSLNFHYCPLVKGWQKAGCTDEEIAKLCDIAMCGDHGIERAMAVFWNCRSVLPRVMMSVH